MIEVILLTLVFVLAVLVILLALWVNQMANALNAVGLRLATLEQRMVARNNDPVANFKTL